MSVATTIPWRDRVVIARHEISCAIVILADLLAGRPATETDSARLTLCLQRLRAVSEVRS